MQLMFATKRVEGQFEAALLIDGKFQRSGTSRSLTDLLRKLLDPVLSIERADGAEVLVNVTILEAEEVARAAARSLRQQRTQEADLEAAEIEKFNAAQAREKKAREGEPA